MADPSCSSGVRCHVDGNTYTSPSEVAMLSAWLHSYNYHRSHTALRGLSPIARVNNLSGNYI